ncbi:hypothetical protein A9Q74_10485 [Colwellia sp. 39_35_sub15_T18]|nr:hypothetical protein A9Q74_10485 [Colwellia sp. 39_35_sub15_T18]
MSRLIIIALLLIYLLIDAIFRLSELDFNQGEIKNNANFDDKLIFKEKVTLIDFRTDIFPTSSGGLNKAQGNTALLSSDTITFDQTQIRLLAISLKNNVLYATFKASQEKPIEGFGHYYHASKGEDVLGATLVNITANTIELHVKEQQFTLNLFNSGESNAVK